MTTHTIPLETLPVWMRRAQRGTDWGALLALLFSFALALPFLLQPTLPNTNAVENYAFRTADYVDALREGVWYPRWSPHTFGGYGAPIPHFYPPAAPYTAALLHIVFTGDTLQAVQLVFALAYCLAGVAVYQFVLPRLGAAAGLIACLLYAASPYLGHITPYILGDLSGMMGMALLPALLWSADRLLLRNRPLDAALLALITAALILSDLRYAAAGAALLALLLYEGRSKRALLTIGVVLIGGGAASFYWLPALLERDFITWLPGVAPSLSRLNAADLLLPLRPIDPAAQTPTAVVTLGVGGWLLCALVIACMVMFLAQRRTIPLMKRLTTLVAQPESRFVLLFFIPGVVTLFALLAAFPAEFWAMGVVAFCFAVSGGGVVLLLRRLPGRWYRLLLPSLLILLLLLSLPVWMIPARADAIQSVTPGAQVEYELSGFGVAVLPPSAPVPAATSPTLLPNRTLTRSYRTGSVIKIDSDQLRGRLQVALLEHTHYSDRFQIQALSSTTLTILTAHFPGWTATLNDTPLAIERSPTTGLISLPIPAGSSGELAITFESTPIRTGAWLVSGLSVAIAAALTWGRYRRSRDTFDEVNLLDVTEARLIGLVAAGFIILLIFSLREPGWFPQPGFGLDGRTALSYRSDIGLEALAFSFGERDYRAGETIEVTLYWRALRPLSDNYRVRAALVRYDPGLVLPHTPLRHPGGYPTRRWSVNRYVTDAYRLPTDSTFIPGQYLVAFEVFGCDPACTPDTRPTFFDQTGAELGEVFVLPTFVTIR
jgi:energy-coupling factor transporter transmembrane protein EcfT